MSDPWFNQHGDVVHPNAPSGGGGSGSFAQPGPLGGHVDPRSKLPHPQSPAAQHLTLDKEHKLQLQRASVRRSDPVPVPPQNVGEILAPEGAKLTIGGIWGDVTRGSVWRATDGRRFVLSATSTDVVYYQRGSFFFQTAAGFIGEVTTYPFAEAGRRSAFLVTVAETEMKLIMGIIAGGSGVGFAIVVGTEAVEWVTEHRRQFPVWQRAVRVFLEVRQRLRVYAPTLYDKLFDAVLSRFYGDAKSKLTEAATPEVIAFLVGVILGHLGKAASKGPVAPLAIVLMVIEAMVKRFFLSVVPGAVSLTAKQYDELAHELIGKLQQSGITMTREDMLRIFEEVQKHPDQIKAAYKALQEAVEQIGATSSGD